MGEIVRLGFPVSPETIKDIEKFCDTLETNIQRMIQGVKDGRIEEGRCVSFKANNMAFNVALLPLDQNPHKPFGGHISAILMNNVCTQLLQMCIDLTNQDIALSNQMVAAINILNQRFDISWLVDVTTERDADGNTSAVAQHYRYDEKYNIIYQIERRI